MNQAKWLCSVMVTDPNTGDEVEVAMYKHDNGAILGIDASYIEQVAEEDEEDDLIVYVGDPFNYDQKLKLIEE